MTSRVDFGVEEELTLVEERIRHSIRSQEPLLNDIAQYVIQAGGKRIRPLVALLANKAVGGKNLSRVVEVAAALELIHSATLVHDDINDDSGFRRGRESAYRKFGVHTALVAGDFLFVKAFALGGRFEPDVVDLTAAVCTGLAEAEIVQRRHMGDLSTTRDQYFDIIRRKTAMPIGAGAHLGAKLGGGTPEEVEALTVYGTNLGLAFQIVDDILDVDGDPIILGKPVGTDLKEGNMTLLVLHALNDGSDVRGGLSQILAQPTRSEADIERGLALIRESGAIEKAREEAVHFGSLATAALDPVRTGPGKEALAQLVEFVIHRNA